MGQRHKEDAEASTRSRSKPFDITVQSQSHSTSKPRSEACANHFRITLGLRRDANVSGSEILLGLENRQTYETVNVSRQGTATGDRR